MRVSSARRLASFVAALALSAAIVPAAALGVGDITQPDEPEAFDVRSAETPGAAVRNAASALAGAGVTYDRFGSPRMLIDHRGWLASGLSGDAVTVAREFLRQNAAAFGVSSSDVAELELVNDSRLAGSDAHAVLLRQQFGDLPVVGGGMIVVGVSGSNVASAASTLTQSPGLAGEPSLAAAEAWQIAARGAGVEVPEAKLDGIGSSGGFKRFDAASLEAEQQVRLAALPMPGAAARRVWEVNVVDNGPVPVAFTAYVDSHTGEVIRRVNRLDEAADQPNWKYFQNIPPLDGSGADRRVVGCFPDTAPVAPCTVDERTTEAAAPAPWDILGGSGPPSFTTNGNNADTALSQASPFTPSGLIVRPTSPTRDYIAPFTNQWQATKCSPSVFLGPPVATGGTDRNDVNAAIISLFSNHNHMHDWSYNLGFTEQNFNMQVNNFGKGGRQGDPEIGDAQAGSTTGGAPTYTGRDNANQITLQDGVAPITNMYLWQPIASAFYPPCVDGDFDMTVIGHEYTHAISNRMVGGPDNGLTSTGDGQARAMGESFSDLTAVEFLQEYNLSPADDENPFAVGPYVTGSEQKGIRNYGMNQSPLNFSNVQGYDGSGVASPHDDGEIWSAVNFDIRQALIAKYGAGTAAEQIACADGQTPVEQCPGNRRWMQLVFDSYLLMPPDGEVSMLEARDALLAADMMRFGGANQSELWTAFATRGFGEGASSENPGDAGFAGDTDDPNPVPSFTSPLRSDEATLTFKPISGDAAGDPASEGAELFVGDYEGNVTPVADTDPATDLGATVQLLPGTYSFVARADGFGAQKFSRQIDAGQALDLNVIMPTNQASIASGASTSGDGVNRGLLIDDTEETDWAAINRMPNASGAQVTVDLAGGEQLVDRVNVSALLRGRPDDGDDQDDPGNQNRFTALRQFEIQTCIAGDANAQCGDASGFQRIYTSPADAFPGDVPRPLAPDMNLRSFNVPDTTATHVRMVVVTNQCLGNPVFMDNTLENDPSSNSDCRLGNPLVARSDRTVRAAELQVFSSSPSTSITPTSAPPPSTPPSGGGDVGNPAPSGPCEAVLEGSKRSDKLVGTSASDRLLGRGGDDRLEGLSGDDCVRGGAGRDRLRGGSGADRIKAGRGQDKVLAGRGSDTVRASRGRADTINCGPGRDLALIGRGDETTRCERVRRR